MVPRAIAAASAIALDEDGLAVSDAGEWGREKHRLLEHYVAASSGARKKFNGRTAYADLYCGPGRQWVHGSHEAIDGSPVVAWKASVRSGAPFARVYIGDESPDYVVACTSRLRALGAEVEALVGNGPDIAKWYADRVDPQALKLVFADPYNLRDMPWDVFRVLVGLRHVDLIVHFSQADLTRNLKRYLNSHDSVLETFAPGWEAIHRQGPKEYVRVAFFRHWLSLFGREGLHVANEIPLMKNMRNVPLYRLVHFSRHELAEKLWNSVATRQSALPF